jgi:hypothetical protein
MVVVYLVEDFPNMLVDGLLRGVGFGDAPSRPDSDYGESLPEQPQEDMRSNR